MPTVPPARPWRRYRDALWARVRRYEAATLAAVLLVALALFAFARLADEMMEGDTHAFDRAVLLALRDPADLARPIGPTWLAEMARDITGLGSTVVLTIATITVVGFLFIVRRHGAALLVLVAVVGGTLLGMLLKSGFDRSRPDIVPHLAVVYTASFPSSHAMLSAVTYLTLGALLAPVQAVWAAKLFVLAVAVLLAILVGLSRIYLGVHWPTDVLAGWAVGSAWAMLCWIIALRLQRRGRLARTAPNQTEAG